MALAVGNSRLQQETKINKTFSDAFSHCIDILKSKQEYVTDRCGEIRSRRSFLLGQEMFEFFREMRQQLVLKETAASSQPVIVKREPSDSAPAGRKCFIYVRPEERRAADMRLNRDKCVAIKIEDEGRTTGTKRTRRRVQQVIFDSSDSEDRDDDDSDYNYDDNDNKESDEEAPEETRPKKRQRTNSGSDNSGTNETQEVVSDVSPSVSVDDEGAAPEEIPVASDSQDHAKIKRKMIPYSIKEKAVKMSREHPDWSWKKVGTESGCSHILRSGQVFRQWKQSVESGFFYKRNFMNKYVYQKIIEMKKEKKKITMDKLIDWCLEVEDEYLPKDDPHRHSRLRAKNTWLGRFKKSYKITGRAHDLQVPSDNEDVETDEDCNNEKQESSNTENGNQPTTKKKNINLEFGPRKQDKAYEINKWIYNKCLEYKETNRELDFKFLKDWLAEAKSTVLPEYKGKELFQNTRTWFNSFKEQYNITGDLSDLQLGNLTQPKNRGGDEDSEEDSDESDDESDD